jgi:hypothetical protein
MAPGEKVNVALDADMVAEARERFGAAAAGLDDAAVAERAINAYLLRRQLEQLQSGPGLTAEEADELAYEELHASRRERRDVA